MKPLAGLDAEEFRKLRLFCELLWPRLLPADLLTDEANPARNLERLAARSPASALRGLRESTNDLLEMTQDIRGTALAELDQLLADSGAPTVTALRAVRIRSIFKILRAGSVQTEHDYRLLQTALSDMGSSLLSSEARALGESILASSTPPRGAG